LTLAIDVGQILWLLDGLASGTFGPKRTSLINVPAYLCPDGNWTASLNVLYMKLGTGSRATSQAMTPGDGTAWGQPLLSRT